MGKSLEGKVFSGKVSAASGWRVSAGGSGSRKKTHASSGSILAVHAPAGTFLERLEDISGLHSAKAEAFRMRKIQYSSLEEIAGFFDMSVGKMAETVHISSSTLSRRKREGELQEMESDRVARLADVMRTATDLFDGDVAATREWMLRPREALGGLSPLECAQTHRGADAVKELVMQLMNGVFV